MVTTGASPGWVEDRVEIAPDRGREATDSVAIPAISVTRSIWTWFWVGVLAACLPMLVIYFSRMWRLPHYQYFPFAMLAVAYLAYRRSDRRFYPPASIISLVCVAIGAGFLFGSWSLESPWMAAVAFVLFSAGCLHVMRGPKDLSLLALAFPLLLLIRLPLGMDQTLVIELQQFTTGLSSLLLDVFGIPHSVDRNIIQLPSRELFVAEACSGIQSVFTLAFMSTLIVTIYRRRLWLVPLYLVIALVLAVAGNVLRVSSVAAADYWFGLDLAEGWPHDLLGYLTLGIAALFLISFDRLIVTFLHSTSRSGSAAKHNPLVVVWNYIVDDGSAFNATDHYYGIREETKTIPPHRLWLQRSMSRWQSKPVLMTIGILMTIGFAITSVRAFQVDRLDFNNALGMFTDGILWEPSTDVFESFNASDSVSGGQLSDRESFRDGDNPILGRNADTWKYTRIDPVAGPITGQMVVSQSYISFHELCFCYEIGNWRVLSRQLRSSSDSLVSTEDASSDPAFRNDPALHNGTVSPPVKDVPAAYAIFRNDEGNRGYLWYAAVSGSGVEQVPPDSAGILTRRFGATLQPESMLDEPIMMIQIFVPTDSKLRAATINAITNDFIAIRAEVARRVRAAQPTGVPETSDLIPDSLEITPTDANEVTP